MSSVPGDDRALPRVTTLSARPGTDVRRVAQEHFPGIFDDACSGEVRFGAGTTLVAVEGVPVHEAGGASFAVLSDTRRRRDDALSVTDIGSMLTSVRPGSDPWAQVLPPFAALAWDSDRGLVHATADPLGFRHLYRREDAGWTALSTSARDLAGPGGARVDRDAVAVQSLLGWQLGTTTMFAGVSTLPAGRAVTVDAGAATYRAARTAEHAGPALGLRDGIRQAAALLRTYLGAFLDQHPDAVLQLTGGQDSRILLSAIPPARRRDVAAMTLAVPGSDDAGLASELAARCGMRHTVIDLDGLSSLSPAEGHGLVARAAARLECAADPVAAASVDFAESSLEPRPRLSGLGGEVARGFYYFGPARDVGVTAGRVARLARWRMFSNEAVGAGVLRPEFLAFAESTALASVQASFATYGPDWLTATDAFYLHERMRRWAGVLASATCLERPVVNPMLDDRFLGIAARLPARAKHRSRFLAGLSVALDPDLAQLPLDGRPPPAVYAKRTVGSSTRLAGLAVEKVAGKVVQRAVSRSRPPAGGEVLSTLVSRWYRDNAAALDPVRALGVVDDRWLDGFLGGTAGATPSTIALLVNLEVACGQGRPARV